MKAGAASDQILLDEAADWLITLHYDDRKPSAEDRAAFDRWRAQSAAHCAAWGRAESMLGTFAQVPPEICKQTLAAAPRLHRRRSLGALAALLVAAPTSWLAWRELSWREWMADEATALGEQRSIALPDGSRLTLNTASAVAIRFTAEERRVRLLAGEILVTTHADPSPRYRPFLVQTREGTAQALGTRFSVRRVDAATTRVAVFEHAVGLQTVQGAMLRLEQGGFVDFSAQAIGVPSAVERSAALWERGMLLARDMRLADVLAEMARFRSGALRCDPAVAELRVSGALSLKDTQASLQLLAQSLPVRIAPQAGGAISVGPP
ncbi:FecR domain-containing protein [Comamonas antarctica]|uniref:FecR domain-containing protein n=1 Tax=Comamonas antarctica TaxID=2743470 RepID=A0A6N1WYC6_9BURK|nr:FecR domain-containing protein [Comamonas antarctica]QKV52214.1 FecR domain-containing protein [Comamonas antarctica]